MKLFRKKRNDFKYFFSNDLLNDENIASFNKISYRKFYPFPNLDDGNDHYQPFIILGTERTGSSLLVDLLKSHPNTICFGELFQDERALFNYLGYPTPENKELITYRDENTINFIRDFVYKSYKNNINAVGFKLFYHHARKSNPDILWNYLKEFNRLKIIHIKRKNLFHCLVSAKVALTKEAVKYPEWAAKEIRRMNMGSFSVEKMHRQGQPMIEIKPEECLHYFEKTNSSIEYHDKFFSDKPILHIFYEDMILDMDGISNQMLRFLGLKDFPLKFISEKQITQPLKEIVKNYNELKHIFSGTKWETYFNEC